MRKRLTIFEYIANTKPNDAYILLQKYGKYNRAKDEKELEQQLKHFVRQNGSMGLMALASIHPDKELIEQFISENRVEEPKSQFLNATGSTTNISDDQKETINLSRMMIYGSFILIGLALVMKKN